MEDPEDKDHFGRSLFQVMPLSRTCKSAGMVVSGAKGAFSDIKGVMTWAKVTSLVFRF